MMKKRCVVFISIVCVLVVVLLVIGLQYCSKNTKKEYPDKTEESVNLDINKEEELDLPVDTDKQDGNEHQTGWDDTISQQDDNSTNSETTTELKPGNMTNNQESSEMEGSQDKSENQNDSNKNEENKKEDTEEPQPNLEKGWGPIS